LICSGEGSLSASPLETMFKRRVRATTNAPAPVAAGDANATLDRQWPWIVFVLAHVPLALAMQTESIWAYVHGFLGCATGMWWAVSTNQVHRIGWVAAYIAGSEVLWRMSTDALPWESGKYMVAALSMTALVSTRGLKSLLIPSLLFALLLPSAVLTI